MKFAIIIHSAIIIHTVLIMIHYFFVHFTMNNDYVQLPCLLQIVLVTYHVLSRHVNEHNHCFLKVTLKFRRYRHCVPDQQ